MKRETTTNSDFNMREQLTNMHVMSTKMHVRCLQTCMLYVYKRIHSNIICKHNPIL